MQVREVALTLALLWFTLAPNSFLSPNARSSHVGVAAPQTSRNSQIAKLFDIVLDDASGRLYGSDPTTGTVLVLNSANLTPIATVSFGQASSPTGLALDESGTRLAVALNGFGSIALVDTATMTVADRIYPSVPAGLSMPYDVRFGRPGRLYSVGNNLQGTDYLHVFDTATLVEVGRSTRIIIADPRLAISADRNSLYVGESAFSSDRLQVFDISADQPVLRSENPIGEMRLQTFAIKPDASAIFTSLGQTWTGDVRQQIGSFEPYGDHIEYVPARDRLFVSQGATVVEVSGQASYAVVDVWPVVGKAGALRASKDGNRLYVSTDAGLEVIQLDLPRYALNRQNVGVQGQVSGLGTYSAGHVATLEAAYSTQVVIGGSSYTYLFIGWSIDGKSVGWANPLTITMDAPHTVEAHYAMRPYFADVSRTDQTGRPILDLGARGTIRGYQNGVFGIGDIVRRDQMAALIARALPSGPAMPTNGRLAPPDCLVENSWDCENWGNSFTDQGGSDVNLWRNVGTLKHYGVSLGYSEAVCRARRLTSPCFGPGDSVTYAQTIAFITRGMIAQGYWVAQPNAPLNYRDVPPEHHLDVRTFAYYAGGVPDRPFAIGQGIYWREPATRDWFAHALWAALDSYWGTDGPLADGTSAGGFVR